MKKICFECSAPIIGRADKKFCSSCCKSAYHNRAQAANNSLVRRTNSILKRNRKIIKLLLDMRLQEVSRQTLIAEGFCFKHHTRLSALEGTTMYHCYEYAYSKKNSEIFLLYNMSKKSVFENLSHKLQ